MINFENGKLEEDAYVIIDGVKYPVVMPRYSGKTPISAENLNYMQELIKEDIERYTVLEGTIEMPEAGSGNLSGRKVLNYPEGLNKDNCVPISLIAHNSTRVDNWSTTLSVQNTTSWLLGNADLMVRLGSDSIYVTSEKPGDNIERNDITFKLVLMRLVDNSKDEDTIIVVPIGPKY